MGDEKDETISDAKLLSKGCLGQISKPFGSDGSKILKRSSL